MKKTRKTEALPKLRAKATDAEIAAYYDALSDTVIAAEIDRTTSNPKTAWVEVPKKLLPDVMKLIARRKKLA